MLMAFIAIAVSVTVRVLRNQPPRWTPYTSASFIYLKDGWGLLVVVLVTVTSRELRNSLYDQNTMEQ